MKTALRCVTLRQVEIACTYFDLLGYTSYLDQTPQYIFYLLQKGMPAPDSCAIGACSDNTYVLYDIRCGTEWEVFHIPDHFEWTDALKTAILLGLNPFEEMK